MPIKKLLMSAAAISASFSFAVPAYADAEPLLGEIMTVGFNFCPRGSTKADGQLLAINSNQSLYSLYGTQFGGDGRTTFGLPDLRSREAISENRNSPTVPPEQLIGATGGSTQMTIPLTALPSHAHTGQLRAYSGTGNTHLPQRNSMAVTPDGEQVYSTNAPTNNMNVGDINILPTGNGQAISKRSPMLAMTVCIATVGIFPSRN